MSVVRFEMGMKGKGKEERIEKRKGKGKENGAKGERVVRLLVMWVSGSGGKKKRRE